MLHVELWLSSDIVFLTLYLNKVETGLPRSWIQIKEGEREPGALGLVQELRPEPEAVNQSQAMY